MIITSNYKRTEHNEWSRIDSGSNGRAVSSHTMEMHICIRRSECGGQLEALGRTHHLNERYVVSLQQDLTWTPNREKPKCRNKWGKRRNTIGKIKKKINTRRTDSAARWRAGLLGVHLLCIIENDIHVFVEALQKESEFTNRSYVYKGGVWVNTK